MDTEKRQYKWLKALIFICLAIFGIILRSVSVTNTVDFPSLINNAFILEKIGASYHTINLEYIYTTMFSVFFSFVGNKAELAIYFQIVLQVIAISIFYFAIKEFTNHTCAWISYVVFICFPFVFDISIDQFFFMIFSLLFGFAAIYSYIIGKKERRIFLKWIFSVFIALIFTQFIFIDSIFIVILIFGFFLSMFNSKGEKGAIKKTKIICISTYVLGVIISFVLYSIMKILTDVETLESLIPNFFKNIFVFKPNFQLTILDFKEIIQTNLLLSYSILGIFICFMFLSFFQKSKNNSIVITALFFSINAYWIFFETYIDIYMITIALAFIIFVLGVQSLIYLFTNKKVTIVIEELEELEEPEEPEESKEPEESEQLDMIDSKPKKEIKFIENPLPVPKKHVPKELTYQFDPNPDKMHFDL